MALELVRAKIEISPALIEDSLAQFSAQHNPDPFEMTFSGSSDFLQTCFSRSHCRIKNCLV
jgi:hypothetical protein